MKFKFESVKGRLYLITETRVWDSVETKKIDVTDDIMTAVDDMLDFKISNIKNVDAYKQLDDASKF